MHHYHRAFGKSQFFNFRRIFKTGIDVMRLWFVLVIRRQHRRRRRRLPVAATRRPDRRARDYRDFYRGRRVMITGGLGFIGSNLARRLVDLGADVLLVDSLIPDYGGNLFNIDGIADRVRVNVADIRQQSTMNYLVRDREVIFNLAGQVSHIDSMRDPYTDLEINCRSQLTLLEACRNHNPAVKVVFAGTRQVYGRPDSLPVTETHLVRPTDVNGINKAAGEYYHLVYNNVFGVRACSLRLTNVYGPRQLIKHNRQGFIGWFIRLAIEGAADPDLRRRLAAPRLRLRGRRGRRVPARGRQRRVQRRGVQRRRRRADQPPRPRGRCWCGLPAPGRVEYVELAAGEEGDRHRQLLRGFDPVHAATGWTAGGAARRRPDAHGRFLPRSTSRPLRATPRRRRGDRRAIPFLSLVPEATPRGDVRDAIERVISRGWFVLGPELEAFEAEFAAASGRRPRRRRRHRHRRDRPDPARRSASAPATK